MRINELDSVRGAAAVVVVLHHCWQSLLPDQNTYPFETGVTTPHDWFSQLAYWISLSPLRILFSGHAAVGIFFVLSGFVLTKALESPKAGNYAQFAVRRFFRIWVPFAVVILLTAALCTLIKPQPIIGHPWINLSWAEPVNFNLIIGHLSMVGIPPYDTLDNPMWSLIHELRISLLFPLLLPATKRHPAFITIVSLLLFGMLSSGHVYSLLFGGIHDQNSASFIYSCAQTLRYTLFFVLGILLAIKANAINSFLSRNAMPNYLLWLLAIAALCLPYTKAYVDLSFAFGAFLLLALCINSARARQILRHPLLLWLGKISYSLYLVHLVVILALVHELQPYVPIYISVMLAIPLSFLMAEAVNRTIELPSNELGKHLATWPSLANAAKVEEM